MIGNRSQGFGDLRIRGGRSDLPRIERSPDLVCRRLGERKERDRLCPPEVGLSAPLNCLDERNYRPGELRLRRSEFGFGPFQKLQVLNGIQAPDTPYPIITAPQFRTGPPQQFALESTDHSPGGANSANP